MLKIENHDQLNNEQLTIINHAIQQYCKEKGVKLICSTILGSYFLGTNNQYSDVDVFVVTLHPKDYYLNGRDTINTETLNNIDIPGLSFKLDIQHRDLLYYIKELKRGNPTAIDCFLSGIKLYTNEHLSELLKDVINNGIYLNNLINSIHRNKENLTIYNIKETCRIIRDIIRVKQILKNKVYKDEIMLDMVKHYDENLYNIYIKRKEKTPTLTQSDIKYINQIIDDITINVNKTYLGTFNIIENETLDDYVLSLFDE